jgi:hypothetical protein
MTFKEAYKRLKRLPECNFLHDCCDWGDLWDFGFTSELIPKEVTVFGGGIILNKKTGGMINPISVYTDPGRSKPTPIPVPRFAAEGWDCYDEKTDTFKLKPDAPYWAKLEFEEFYGADEFEHDRRQQPARFAYA